MIEDDSVIRCFKKIKESKSPGPDNICGRTLKTCADQLGPVFRFLFQLSLKSGIVPTLWKASTVLPIPKKVSTKQPNDFRPVALTSLIMKVFEKHVKSCILSVTENKMDPLQFAYRAHKSVDDAKLLILDKLYEHLEGSGNHARILFADFSSAFNFMQPYILAQKLISVFHLDAGIVRWIIDFLTNRIQQVSVNNCFSSKIITNVGSPQGCVLSPIFYILYTDDCRSQHDNQFFVKYADDTALLSLLSGDYVDHGPALDDFVNWCDSSCLVLNTAKTKELVIDFRRKPNDFVSSKLHGVNIDVVTEYKYLGTIFTNRLTWDINTDTILKKAYQRLYFLRKLNSFSVSVSTLTSFYNAFIESIISFSCICWYMNLNLHQKNSLERIVRISSKIIGLDQRNLQQFTNRLILKKARTIIKDDNHALSEEYVTLKSGRRYRCVACRTNRRRLSFLPTSIRLLNLDTNISKLP